MTPTPDTVAIRKRLTSATDMVNALCLPRGTAGAREWLMSIPVRPDHDPDIVISVALLDLRDLCDALDRLREERRWRPASEPPTTHGYYLVAHERSGKFDKSPIVSQAWFNPDSNGSKWWASRGYLDKPPQNNNPIPDVVAWQPRPDAAPLPDLPEGG